MKKIFLFLTLIISAKAFSQVYPFDESFTGIPSLTTPPGWEGDMRVRSAHGLYDEKGLAADIGSTDEVDSAITPWIGPLDTNTEFYFWYRMVDDFIYPSTEKHLTRDKFTISISTDSVNYTDLYTIDSSNHQFTLSFKKITFPIYGYGGQVVKFKLRCEFGAGSSYYVDVDSIKVRLNLNTAIEETSADNIKIYPTITDSYVQIEADGQNLFERIELINSCGQTMLSHPFQLNTRMEVSQFPSGFYLVKLHSANLILTRKIIIQR